MDATQVTVYHKTGKVQCDSAPLQARVAKAVTRLRLAMGPASRDDEDASDDNDDDDFFEPASKAVAA